MNKLSRIVLAHQRLLVNEINPNFSEKENYHTVAYNKISKKNLANEQYTQQKRSFVKFSFKKIPGIQPWLPPFNMKLMDKLLDGEIVEQFDGKTGIFGIFKNMQKSINSMAVLTLMKTKDPNFEEESFGEGIKFAFKIVTESLFSPDKDQPLSNALNPRIGSRAQHAAASLSEYVRQFIYNCEKEKMCPEFSWAKHWEDKDGREFVDVAVIFDTYNTANLPVQAREILHEFFRIMGTLDPKEPEKAETDKLSEMAQSGKMMQVMLAYPLCVIRAKLLFTRQIGPTVEEDWTISSLNYYWPKHFDFNPTQ